MQYNYPGITELSFTDFGLCCDLIAVKGVCDPFTIAQSNDPSVSAVPWCHESECYRLTKSLPSNLRGNLLVSASSRTGPQSSWGAFNLFVNVATILTDAFWFSAVR